MSIASSADRKNLFSGTIFVSANKYGMYVNSDFHSQFQMASKVEDKYSFVLDNDGDMTNMLDYYVISGKIKMIS